MRLLLDSHLPLAVMEQLRRAEIDCAALSQWRDGTLRTAPDDRILSEAFEENRILVTFDTGTIPAMLGDWAKQDRHHAGVIVVVSRTIRPNDVGSLVRSLRALVEEESTLEWQDRIRYLRRR